MAFERRKLDRGGHALVATVLEGDGFLAAFSERSGGWSAPPYDSMNLAFTVGDDEEAVRRNRASLVESLAISPPAMAEQVHGTKSVRVGAKRAGAGFEDHSGWIPGADAMTTQSPGVALAVLVADCLPVVLASPGEGAVAIAHVGWRGLAGGILQRVVEAFVDPRGVEVAIGPAIGPCHYAVGEDVALAVAAGSDAGSVTERRAGRTYLDLAGTARAVLRTLGIRRVEDTGLCTACEARRFFSYRRDEVTGRQAGLAMRLG